MRSNKINFKTDFDSERLIEPTVSSCLMFMKFLSGDLASGPQVTRRLIIEGGALTLNWQFSKRNALDSCLKYLSEFYSLLSTLNS